MKKVLVIGCPGAGKSTFARKLREITGLPLVYLDLIWHKSDRTTISKEAFDAALEEVLSEENWILDGNYSRTLERRLQACDTVFLFDLPTEICLQGALSRVGTKREDLPWVEERLDEEFRHWIEQFEAVQMPHIRELLEQFGNRIRVVRFGSRMEADSFLESLKFAF